MVAYIWVDFALGDFGLETFAKGLTTGKAYVWWLMTRKFKIQGGGMSRGLYTGAYFPGFSSRSFGLGRFMLEGL